MKDKTFIGHKVLHQIMAKVFKFSSVKSIRKKKTILSKISKGELQGGANNHKSMFIPCC